MPQVRSYAAPAEKQPLKLVSLEAGELKPEEVEVTVEYCGICHSDLSMLKNEWHMTSWPFVPGHEIVGRVSALGVGAKGLKVGQRVGVGWSAVSCMHCHECLGGDHHLCPEVVPTMVGRHGGFAEKVRSHWAWTIPLPEKLDVTSAGPLFCGGVTVFSPLATFGIKPLDRVGIIGIGGLGHMAVKFAKAWGCEVTAFTSSESKFDEARSFGAHNVVSSRDPKAIAKLARSFDMLIVTANVTMDWAALLDTLKPKGRLHVVGAVLEPLAIPAFSLIMAQRSVSGSPTGSPTMIASMLDFAARHKVAPQVEHFPMSKVNDALAHLEAGKARYRIVLDADFK